MFRSFGTPLFLFFPSDFPNNDLQIRRRAGQRQNAKENDSAWNQKINIADKKRCPDAGAPGAVDEVGKRQSWSVGDLGEIIAAK